MTWETTEFLLKLINAQLIAEHSKPKELIDTVKLVTLRKAAKELGDVRYAILRVSGSQT